MRLPVTDLLPEVRFAVRWLSKNPGFSIITILLIGLSVGAVTVVFSALYTALLRPLPYPEPDRLVILRDIQPNFGKASISIPEFLDWREQREILQETAALTHGGWTLTGLGDAVTLAGVRVSSELFSLLGIKLQQGRVFSAEEQLPEGPSVVIVSASFWQNRLGGRKSVIGSTIELNGVSHQIVGLLAPGEATRLPFDLRSETPRSFWLPLQVSSDSPRGNHFLTLLARLAPGVTVEAAQEGLSSVARRLDSEGITDHGIHVESLSETVLSDSRTLLYLLMGAVILVLLIASANVTNLFLIRISQRRKEMAIRLAIGAGRHQLVGQVLVESLILSIAGGILGLLLASGGISLLQAVETRWFPRASEMSIDWVLLLFVIGMCVLNALLFGIIPARQASSTSLRSVLEATSREGSASRNQGQIRSTLVIAEVALSLTLLIAAGLLLRSFLVVVTTDVGFEPKGVQTFEIDLPRARYDQPARVLGFYLNLLQELESLPAISLAAATHRLPIPGGYNGDVGISGKTFTASDTPQAEKRIVTENYFEAMGTTLVRGRTFTPADADGGARVAIINQEFARRFLSDEEPVGSRIRVGLGEENEQEVVGVVENMEFWNLEVGPRPAVYVPFRQFPYSNGMSVVIQSGGSVTEEQVRRVVARLDTDLPVRDFRPLSDLVSASTGQRRWMTGLILAFATAALLLATLGLYSLLSFSVAQRRHEMGIRAALGANPGQLVIQVLKWGTVLIALGLFAGLTGTWFAVRVLNSLLVGIEPFDPVTLVFVTGLVLLVGLAASLFPAVRASRVDPVQALREGSGGD